MQGNADNRRKSADGLYGESKTELTRKDLVVAILSPLLRSVQTYLDADQCITLPGLAVQPRSQPGAGCSFCYHKLTQTAYFNYCVCEAC